MKTYNIYFYDSKFVTIYADSHVCVRTFDRDTSEVESSILEFYRGTQLIGEFDTDKLLGWIQLDE